MCIQRTSLPILECIYNNTKTIYKFLVFMRLPCQWTLVLHSDVAKVLASILSAIIKALCSSAPKQEPSPYFYIVVKFTDFYYISHTYIVLIYLNFFFSFFSNFEFTTMFVIHYFTACFNSLSLTFRALSGSIIWAFSSN